MASSPPLGISTMPLQIPLGGFLPLTRLFFYHQGYQVIHDPCLDLNVYRSTLGRGGTIIPVDNLPDHILLSGLDLLDGLFAPSPMDTLGTSFMAAYLISSPAPVILDSAAVPSS